MVSNRQNMHLRLDELCRQLNDNYEESEAEPLLDGVEFVNDSQLEQVIVEQVRKASVEIRNSHLPSGVLLLIASHLNLKDFIALSKTNYALHLALTNPRVLDSLYVRIPGVANDYTIPAIQSMLHSRFPELAKQRCLNATAKFSKCIESPFCIIPYLITGVVSSMGGAFVAAMAAGDSLKDHLMFDLHYTNNAAGLFTSLVVIPLFLGGTALGGAAFYYGYELASRCKDKINLRANQYVNDNQSDPAISDKLIIFGLFKNSKQQLQQASLYHKSNHPLELPKQRKMGS